MTRDDVLILAKAGFTAQQIAALAATVKEPAPLSVQAEPAAPAAVPPQTAPAQAAPTAPDVAALMEKLGVLTETIQANGITGSRQPAEQTADDILAAIILPPDQKKE